jgi:hypothetical protein
VNEIKTQTITALGIGDHWHAPGPISEMEAFSLIKLLVGELMIASGAYVLGGKIRIVSRIVKETEDRLTVYFLEIGGSPGKAEVRKGSQAVFADSLSLAW